MHLVRIDLRRKKMPVKTYSCVASNHAALSSANMAAGSSSVFVLPQVFIAKLKQAILKVAPEILVKREKTSHHRDTESQRKAGKNLILLCFSSVPLCGVAGNSCGMPHACGTKTSCKKSFLPPCLCGDLFGLNPYP